MTYQQAIADAIKLFLTMDVATTAVTGSGLFSFCHAAVDAVTIVASSIMAADAVTTITTTAATRSMARQNLESVDPRNICSSKKDWMVVSETTPGTKNSSKEYVK